LDTKVIYFSFLRYADYGNFPKFVQFLQVSQLKGQIEVVHGSARRQKQLIDAVSFDKHHVLYPLNRIEDNNVSLVHKGDVFVRFDEDKRDALY